MTSPSIPDDIPSLKDVLLILLVFQEQRYLPAGLAVDHIDLLTPRHVQQLVVGRYMQHLQE